MTNKNTTTMYASYPLPVRKSAIRFLSFELSKKDGTIEKERKI
jgi:hypothetical protein